MKVNHSFSIVVGEGWFDAPYVRALLDAELPERIKDIEGPESDALIHYAGWSFIEEPLHVALLDDGLRPLALAWIAATTRGLNLTYIVAAFAEGKGLATYAVANAIVVYGERRAYQASKRELTVHAQYEQINKGSSRVAARLGLLPADELGFDVNENGEVRYFSGSEASWNHVLKQAGSILV